VLVCPPSRAQFPSRWVSWLCQLLAYPMDRGQETQACTLSHRHLFSLQFQDNKRLRLSPNQNTGIGPAIRQKQSVHDKHMSLMVHCHGADDWPNLLVNQECVCSSAIQCSAGGWPNVVVTQVFILHFRTADRATLWQTELSGSIAELP
jgi:hypothetical protein